MIIDIQSIELKQEVFMKNYIKNATAVADKVRVDTPYNSYDFDTAKEAQEFLDFVNSDPEYDDPDLGDLIEWIFFYEKENL